jgi:hypothetical protein
MAKMIQNTGYSFIHKKNSGMFVCQNTHKSVFVHHSKAGITAAKASSRRASVDDATWDKIVMGLMEEYDEAWTQLADK